MIVHTTNYKSLPSPQRKMSYAVLILLIICTSARGQVTWLGGNGNWSVGSNWSTGSAPTTGDVVVIPSGTCTIDANVSVGSITISGGTLIQSDAKTITCTGTTVGATQVAFTINSGTFTGSNGALSSSNITCIGTFTQTGGVFTSTAAELRLQGSAFTLSGGSFNHNNGIVRLRAGVNGFTNMTASAPNATFYDVRVDGTNGSLLTLQSDLTVSRDFIAAGISNDAYTIDLDGNDVNVSGDMWLGAKTGGATTGSVAIDDGNINLIGTGSDLTIRNTGIPSPLVNTAYINFLGDGPSTITGDAAVAVLGQGILPNIDISKSSGTLSLVGNITLSGDWTQNTAVDVMASSTVEFYNSTGAQQNIDINYVPASPSFNNIVFESPGSTLLLEPIDVAGDLTIKAGATLDTGNSSNTIRVGGDWTEGDATSTFTPNSGEVVFYGTTNNSVTAFSDFAFIEVNFSGSGSLTLASDVTVTGTLELVNGVINTTDSNLLTLSDNAITTGGSASSYVDGPIEKIGNDPFTFPIGDAGVYRPLGMTSPASASDAFKARYFFEAQSVGTSTDPLLEDLSQSEYWNFQRTSGSSNVTVTLSWDAADTPEYQITNMSHVQVSYWNGSAWMTGGNSGTSGTTAAGTVTSAAPVVGFLTLGSLSENNSPLPITFLSFSAVQAHEKVDLAWKVSDFTACNSCTFKVQRMNRDLQFIDLATLPAFTTDDKLVQTYTYSDLAPMNGLNYYRISHLDADDVASESEIVSVQVNYAKKFAVTPNPWNRESLLTLRLPDSPRHGNLQIDVFDAIGNHVASDRIEVAADQNVILYEPSAALPKGLTVFTVHVNGTLFSSRVLVK
jgi:hypothetical protein